MSLEFIKREGNNAQLKLTIAAKDFEKYENNAYNKNKKKISIPGFRKGRVPKTMIDKYYGEGFFYEDAINEGFAVEYEKGLKGMDIVPVASPTIDIEDIQKGKDVIINVNVVVKPEVELGEYKNLEVEYPDVTVTEKEIEEDLESKRSENARFVNIEDRAVKEGDIVKLDFQGKKNGVPFEGGKAENYTLVVGSKSFIPGFEEGLIGMNLGEEKTLDLTFPKDYQAQELAGKPVTFDVKINEIQEKQLPEIDDEFVKDISEFDTLDELKKDIKENLEKIKIQEADRNFQEDIVEKVVKNAKMDIPEEMIEKEADHMFNEFAQRLAYQGMNIDAYCKYLNKTQSQLKDEMKGEAKKRVEGSLVLEKVKEVENIKHTQEQLDEEYSKMAKSYGISEDEIKKIFGGEREDYIIDNIEMKNALDFLKEHTKKISPSK